MDMLKVGQVLVLTEGFFEQEEIIGSYVIQKDLDVEKEFNNWRNDNCIIKNPHLFGGNQDVYQDTENGIPFHEYLMKNDWIVPQESKVVNIGGEFERLFRDDTQATT